MSPAGFLRALLAPLLAANLAFAEGRIDFEAEVLPILAGRCFECHGSDSREGGLRLTNRGDAFRPGEYGIPVITPGASDLSPLVDRLLTSDLDERMPKKGEPLSESEIALIREWIDEGANWPEDTVHWAYRMPVRPRVERDGRPLDGSEAIDEMVRHRLAEAGLLPARPATPAAQMRRLHFDLIGLPPAPETLEAFVADPSDEAWEAMVDELLASRQFGEHWANGWLDLARFAEGSGFMAERILPNWPYRDWVVRAINRDLPFDEFTIDQLAGDLRSGPTVDQLVATGFHRSAPLNFEAGVRLEEARVQQVIDRVNTTATVWLGATIACAQCHDHKFDPITQSEYFELYAFFNNDIPEQREVGIVLMPAGASVQVLSDDQKELLLEFVAGAERLLPSHDSRRRAQQKQRLRSLRNAAVGAPNRKLADEPLDLIRSIAGEIALTMEFQASGIHWVRNWKRKIRENLATLEEDWRAVGLRAGPGDIVDPQDPAGDCVRVAQVAPGVTRHVLEFEPPSDATRVFRLDLITGDSAAEPGEEGVEAIVAGLSLHSASSRDSSVLEEVRFESPDGNGEEKLWSLLDGDPLIGGLTLVPSVSEPQQFMLFTGLPRSPGDSATHRLGIDLRSSSESPTTIRVCLYANPDPGDLFHLDSSTRRDLERILDAASPHEERALRRQVALARQPEPMRLLRDAEKGLAAPSRSGRARILWAVAEPRVTRIFERGDPTVLGSEVSPGTPAALHPFSDDQPRDRLGLARWLVASGNPLTARVTVNRWWGQLLGKPLVATPEDFGIRGERPTHPEILDWLAVELQDSGWSRKHIVKTIVNSRTYRQAIEPRDPSLLQSDPRNLLLARANRRRLSAEAIRDNALEVSGLLVDKVGGPSVYPPQPEGVWVRNGVVGYTPYRPSPGAGAYRRSLYTIRRRSTPPPNLLAFDSVDRTACTVRRDETNTPLQALTLLNDETFVEAAFALAERILREAPGDGDAERLDWSFRVVVSRSPSAEEREVLQSLLVRRRALLGGDPDVARAILAGSRYSAEESDVPVVELVSWFAVARTLLNLNETLYVG